jgi:hypothetical protein
MTRGRDRARQLWPSVQQRTDLITVPDDDERRLYPHRQENIMGKYVLGWLLGIPAVVLVVIYFIAN